MTPQTGMLLGERYRLTDRIAVGGMGEVWKAQDEVLAREVAAKILKPEYTGDAGFLTRFRNEARHTAALAHPNIAAIYDYGETDSAAYLVMELVPGEPLNDLIAREGELPVPQAMRLLAQAAHGLAAAHDAGVVHRDVKPGNLLITPDGRLKVTDFGIARAGDQVALTATGQVMGTAQYLAPEQAMGRAAVPASDVYALGVVAYEMLTGGLPFTGESPVSIALAHVNATPAPLPEWLPPGARALVASSMSKDPAERPADATTFARAAEAVAQGRDADALALLPATSALAGLEPGPETARTQVVTSTGYPVASAGTSVLPGGRGGAPATPAEGTPVGGTAAGGRPRRRLTTPLVALLLLVVFVVVGSLLASGVLGRDDDPDGTATPTPTAAATSAPTTTAPTTAATTTGTSGPTTSAPTTTASDGVLVDPDQFVGKDRAAVVAALEGMGLRVRQTGERDTDEPRDQVLRVEPSGELNPGERVTVVYADPRPTQTTRPTTRPTATPTTSPTTEQPGGGGDGPGDDEGSGPGATGPPTPAPTGTAAAGDGDAAGTGDRAIRALAAGPTWSGYDMKDSL